LPGYYAVYLELFTAKHLTERLAALYSISAEQIVDVVCRGSSTGGGSGLNVIVTDSVIHYFIYFLFYGVLIFMIYFMVYLYL